MEYTDEYEHTTPTASRPAWRAALSCDAPFLFCFSGRSARCSQLHRAGAAASILRQYACAVATAPAQLAVAVALHAFAGFSLVCRCVSLSTALQYCGRRSRFSFYFALRATPGPYTLAIEAQVKQQAGFGRACAHITRVRVCVRSCEYCKRFSTHGFACGRQGESCCIHARRESWVLGEDVEKTNELVEQPDGVWTAVWAAWYTW